jgi:hypothetical protein
MTTGFEDAADRKGDTAAYAKDMADILFNGLKA